jgi:hypothetical protein
MRHNQGRRKHQKIGGGAPASRGHFRVSKRAPKKFFPEMLATGGGRKHFPVVVYRNCTFFTNFFKKTGKFPNKKGTFDVNLVFTATLACTKRALFITKKGTFHHNFSFSPLKNWGGGCAPCAPPGSYAPACSCKEYCKY